MTDTGRIALPGFSENAIDRCDEVRANPETLARWFADPDARRIVLDGLDPVAEEAGWLAREVIPATASLEDHILLGRDPHDFPLFVELRTGLPHGGQYAPRVWDAATMLSPGELSLYGCARSLVDWHARHGFCAVCGSRTSPVKAGWSRLCDGCGAEHFPRVDPVVIMLAEYHGRILLGRQARFPPRRYSALAGFIEPGETVEGAVARELYEEAGIRVRNVRYVMSQPWPFPSSLMMACVAEAEHDELRLDEREIEHAFWADAEDVRSAMRGDDGARFIAPPAVAVAHHLLRHWLDERE